MDNHYGIQLKWLSVTCFEMVFGGMTVVSDPFVTDNPGSPCTWENIEHCDLVTLSHTHWDHIMDLPAVIEKFHPPLLCGSLSAVPLNKWLDYDPTWIYPMDVNLELDFGDVKVRALFGRHTDLNRTESVLMHSFSDNPLCADPQVLELQRYGSMEYRNYLYTAANGTKLLLWGNDPTDVQRRMVNPLQPEVAILQLSKQDPQQMAEFAAAIGCKILIPHHLDLKTAPEVYLKRAAVLKDSFEKLVPDGQCIIPEHGKWIFL